MKTKMMKHNIDEMMKSVETPQWMLDLFKAIDALDMSPASGFAIFADDIEMMLGNVPVKGIAEVKKFFVKLDAPFETVHNVTDVWKRIFLFEQ